MRLFILVLFALLGLAACRTAEVPPGASLAGTTWEWHAFAQDGDSLSTADGLDPDQLHFDDNGGIRMQSCNTCVGTYEADATIITVEGLACTRRACASSRRELGHYLSGRVVYTREGDNLLLRVPDPLSPELFRLYFTRVE